jgi:hypothetical protein
MESSCQTSAFSRFLTQSVNVSSRASGEREREREGEADHCTSLLFKSWIYFSEPLCQRPQSAVYIFKSAGFIVWFPDL